MFWSKDKVIIKVRFTGDEIEKLKVQTEKLYNLTIPIHDIPPKVLSIIEDATKAAWQLNGYKDHKLNDESSIFGKFEMLFNVLQEYIERNINGSRDINDELREMSRELLILTEVFDRTIGRILNQEVSFIQELSRIKRKAKSTMIRLQSELAA